MPENRNFQITTTRGRAPCCACDDAIEADSPHVAIEHRYRSPYGHSIWSIRLHPCCANAWLAKQRGIVVAFSKALNHPIPCVRCELSGH